MVIYGFLVRVFPGRGRRCKVRYLTSKARQLRISGSDGLVTGDAGVSINPSRLRRAKNIVDDHIRKLLHRAVVKLRLRNLLLEVGVHLFATGKKQGGEEEEGKEST